ncbi:MAG: Xaa-Pro peptidase family protein [Bacillota bacterium]|nr:Xaa-Pro peptidase family protein [Bacillota bacterium]
MRLAPREEVYGRIKRLQVLMADNGWSGIFINQLVNLFYYSGTMQGMCLFVPQEGEPVLFVRKNMKRACNESPLEHVVSVQGFKQMPEVLKQEGYEDIAHLGLELEFLPVIFYQKYLDTFPNAKVVDAGKILRQVRMVKSPYEQKIFLEAGKLAQSVYEKIPSMIQPGMTEIALAAKVEYEMRSRGHQGILRSRGYNQEIYYGYILFGENSLIPSYFDGTTGGKGLSAAFAQGSSNTTLEAGRPILVDYAFVLDGYIVDLTRIYSVGKLDERLTAAHQAAIAIQNKLVQLATPGVKTNELFLVAQEIAKEHGFLENFMGTEEARAKFVGHGVGLELDEAPVIAGKLQFSLAEGMVLAIEPKFFFPKQGIVGVENTFIVRHDGLEKVCSLSDEITIISSQG